MNDRLLRVTVILSVLALVGMAGAGAVAAQENFNVSDLNVEAEGVDQGPDASVEGDSSLTVTANVTNVGNQTGEQDITFELPPGTVVETVSNVNLSAGENTTVQFLNGQTPNDLGLTPGTYNHSVVSENDSANGTLEVADPQNNAFIRGQILDQNGDAIAGASNPGNNPVVGIRIVDLDAGAVREPVPADANDPDVIEDDNGDLWFVPQDDDFYQREVPIFGQNTTYRVDAAVFNFNPNTGLYEQDTIGFEDFTNTKTVEADTTENFEITLVRLVQPEEFDITQSAESALADGDDTITFNVSIIGDLDGERMANEPFTVFHDGGDDISIANGSNFETEDDGFVEFEVSSNASKRVEFEFVAENGVSEIREKNFILQGEGQVIGDVWDVDSPDLRSLPDARIWAVQKDTFTQNSIQLPNTGYANAGDQSFYRVWRTEDPANFTQGDPEVDELLDITQDYRIDNNGTNENLSISRVRELNTTDSAVGSGFAVRANVNNPDNVYVTPLEPGYYYIEHSFNQRNASDQRFVNDSAPTDPFNSVGGVGASGGNSAVELTTDLTFEATRQFSQFSGQNLTDITDENGEYVLKNMYTDFQAGVDYTVIANKAGYEIEFIDPLVTESGAFFEDGADENFGLERVEEDVEVNVTNLAALPSIDDAPEDADNPDAYDQFAFANQTDRFSQEVPRDGRTIDVIQVNTQTESGAPVDEEIELSVPAAELPGTEPSSASNFTGEFVAVAGGTEVSEDTDAPTITIRTGADGQAIVWLQSDLDEETLASVNADNFDTGGLVCETGELGDFEFFSGIVAQSPTDAGVIDATCKDFSGTAVLRTAELSGVVTNQDNDPVESRVWLEEIDLNAPAPTNPLPQYVNQNHRIEITRNGANNYDVRQVYDNVSFATSPPTVVETVVIGQETGLSANDLRNYEGFGTTMFPQLAVAGDGEDGFTLLTDSDDVDDPVSEDATYTLPEVPAESAASPVTGVTPTGIDRATFNFRGTAVQTPVQVARTSTANIEITTPTGAEFNVTNVDAPETVNQGDTFDVSANVTNEGVATSEQDVDYELINDETGSVVASDTASLTLGGDESDTVTFEDIDTTGLDAGNYTNVVTTVDDTQGEEAPTEIVTDGTGGNGDSPIDGVSDSLWNAVTQGDGELSLGDLGTAITQYQDDGEIDGEPIGLGQLGDLISYYQNEVAN